MSELTSVSPMPNLIRARQRFPVNPPVDISAAVTAELKPLLAGVPRGAEIAIAVGSRGITRLAEIVAAAIRVVREHGAFPVIVPAMGSHGGGTPSGQTELLAGYGVSEALLGVPLRSDMTVRSAGATAEGDEVVCGLSALGADRVLLINRVKPHTDFRGAIGSGLVKMLVVGLGKHEGARRFHAAASRSGYETALRQFAAVLKPVVPLLGGLAILEDQRHQPVRLCGVPPAALEARETELCQQAHALMPRLPFDDVDLLIVDQMGKNISGTGMDPAIIGRMIHGYSTQIDPQQPPPRVRRLLVRELTPESHGNAIGIGMADFTTERLVRAMDSEVTRINALTALSIQGAKLPICFPNDREAIETGLCTLALPDPTAARVVRIRDTLSVEVIEFSETLQGQERKDCELELLSPPRAPVFDPANNLPALISNP